MRRELLFIAVFWDVLEVAGDVMIGEPIRSKEAPNTSGADCTAGLQRRAALAFGEKQRLPVGLCTECCFFQYQLLQFVFSNGQAGTP